MGKKTCKNCYWWKNNQRDLNYWESIGFCVNKNINFSVEEGRAVGVVDLENIRNRNKIMGNPSHDFETGHQGSISESRYILTTDENFGCNKFEGK